MGRGNGRRQKELDRQPAKNPLHDDGPERKKAENPHPAALFRAPRPDGENNGEQAGCLGDHAVRVLELHASDQLRNFVPGAE